jgi:hypothetical protein
MKHTLLFISILLLNIGCKSNQKFFPEKKRILISEFSNFENFFPIATIEINDLSLKDKIHIMYVAFDPDIDHEKPFAESDNIDEFTFNILDNGLYQPTFDSSALVIGDRFKEYFDLGKEKYEKEKENGTYIIETPNDPEWWQNDRTPLNSKGQKMKFICQVDMYKLSGDDCRLYVFYDNPDKKVKYIYQRG